MPVSVRYIVDDVDAEAERLQAAGVALRSEVIRGIGGDQVLIEDPSGNPIELFASKPPG
jgi:predicted enzyme related to lactoylglutathione lyase